MTTAFARRLIVISITTAAMCAPLYGRAQQTPRFGLGKRVTAEEVRASDTDVRPDGQGLPPGTGTVQQGTAVYAGKCVACHGATGVEGPFNRLVGRMPGDAFNFASDPKLLSLRTIGSYWPYATTLYDYINRAMPFDAPGSLKPDEVYSVVAYLLNRNGIVAATAVMSARTLPAVVMPSRDKFVRDNRRGGPEIR